MKQFVFLLFLKLTFVNGQSGDTEGHLYCTSVVSMIRLLGTEQWLVEASKDNLDEVALKALPMYSSFIENVKKEHEKSAEDYELYLSNPLNSFALLRRLNEDWPAIIDCFMIKSRKYVRKLIANNLLPYPSYKDMTEAALGMERIRETYNLNVADMADGILDGVKYDARLSNSDLIAIALELYKSHEEVDIASWANASLHSKNQGFGSVLDFDQESAELLYEDTKNQKRKTDVKMGYYRDFERNCRGENLKNISGLHCHYNYTFHPYFLLAPMKMEELSLDPYIVVYYDALENHEIEYIKYQASGQFRQALVGGYSDNGRNDALVRTTQTASVHFANASMQKILAITGLDPAGSRFPIWSALNYGLGGHYDIHYDSMFEDYDPANDDRIASLLIYLNDVEQGGQTVFPKLGISVKPTKGSLLMWYNLKNNGQHHDDTLHGACPVIVGSKWAVVDWVNERAQFRTMPCYNP